MQKKIKKVAELSVKQEGQIVIFGKKGHAEVIGLMGAAGPNGILVTGRQDVSMIDFTRPVWLFSQTTRSKDEYELVAEIIRLNLEKQSALHPDNTLKIYNTICRHVWDREPRLREFAGKHDVIIFVSGKKSSNGRMLFDVCLNENSRSHFISSPAEIDRSWFSNAKSTGICGATSTPKWLIQKVADALMEI